MDSPRQASNVTLRGGLKRERRRHPRAITEFTAVLTTGKSSYSARVINLSMGGALLDLGGMVPTPAVEVGSHLSLDIRCRGGSGPLHVEGRAVLWNTTSADAPLLAVQFDELAEDSGEVLEELMFEALSELRGRILADMP